MLNVFWFVFYLGFTARQDYFTHFEPSQSLDGAKTEYPQEKIPDHPQAQLGLSHKAPWVELQSSMSWNCHMDQTVKKANSTLGFLCRNLRIINEQTKTAAYFSIIEYCSTVWTASSEFGTYRLCKQRRARLARTSAARSYKQSVKRNLQTESQIPSPSDWLGMCS